MKEPGLFLLCEWFRRNVNWKPESCIYHTGRFYLFFPTQPQMITRNIRSNKNIFLFLQHHWFNDDNILKRLALFCTSESGKFKPAKQTMDACAYSVGITCLRDGLPEPWSAAGYVPRFFILHIDTFDWDSRSLQVWKKKQYSNCCRLSLNRARKQPYRESEWRWLTFLSKTIYWLSIRKVWPFMNAPWKTGHSFLQRTGTIDYRPCLKFSVREKRMSTNRRPIQPHKEPYRTDAYPEEKSVS